MRTKSFYSYSLFEITIILLLVGNLYQRACSSLSSPQFHADKLSSAHIYLRMPNPDDSWEAIPEALVTDLAQLTKANSIEGNKKDNVTIIYTPWSNLKKDGSMAVGQVSFKDPRKVRRVLVPTRENAIVNRLNKTKVEKHPDFMQEREDMLKQRRRKDMAAVQARVGKPLHSRTRASRHIQC